MTTDTLLDTARIRALILCEGRHTVSGIYLACPPPSWYWSLVKFPGRGQWDETWVVPRLIGLLLESVTDWVCVYDHTMRSRRAKSSLAYTFFAIIATANATPTNLPRILIGSGTAPVTPLNIPPKVLCHSC